MNTRYSGLVFPIAIACVGIAVAFIALASSLKADIAGNSATVYLNKQVIKDYSYFSYSNINSDSKINTYDLYVASPVPESAVWEWFDLSLPAGERLFRLTIDTSGADCIFMDNSGVEKIWKKVSKINSDTRSVAIWRSGNSPITDFALLPQGKTCGDDAEVSQAVILDEDRATLAGSWPRSFQSLKAYGGKFRQSTYNGDARVKYVFQNLKGGASYDIYVTWPDTGITGYRLFNEKVILSVSGDLVANYDPIIINQRNMPSSIGGQVYNGITYNELKKEGGRDFLKVFSAVKLKSNGKMISFEQAKTVYSKKRIGNKWTQVGTLGYMAADAVMIVPVELSCGNETVESGEICDRGSHNDQICTPAYDSSCTYCSTDCSEEITVVGGNCGDGTTQEPMETCDDGAENGQPNKCNVACNGITPATCGNETVEAGEICDRGSQNGQICTPAYNSACTYCSADCSEEITVAGGNCGDGTTQEPMETCDDGSLNGKPGNCNASCSGRLPATVEEHIVSSKNATLVISNAGILKSLHFNGRQILKYANQPVIKINYSISPQLVTEIAENHYLFTFQNSAISAEIKIEPLENYFTFEIVKFSNPLGEPVTVIPFINIFSDNVIEYNKKNEWAIQADNDEVLIRTLTLNAKSHCFGDRKQIFTTCYASPSSGAEGAKGALIVSDKLHYFENLESVVINENLPHPKINDKWFRYEDSFHEGYLFASLTKENYLDILKYAREANLKKIIIRDPIILGSYNRVRSELFDSNQQFINALRTFGDAGIEIGIHTFLARTEAGDPMFTPEKLLKTPVGHLSNNLESASALIPLDENLSTNQLFIYNLKSGTDNSYPKHRFLIGSEIMLCGFSGNYLNNCERGLYGTRESMHLAGAEVFSIPDAGSQFHSWMYLDPLYLNESASSFAQFISEIENAPSSNLKVRFLYADGHTYPRRYDISDHNLNLNYTIETGLMPYYKAFSDDAIVQFGSNISSSWSFYMTHKGATWDSVSFKGKEFDKKYKLPLLSENSVYRDVNKELGFWAPYGAQYSFNKDQDAMNLDNVHYIMSRMLALRTSMGLNLMPIEDLFFWERNGLMSKILKTIGLYHELIAQNTRNPILTPQIISHYSNLENEGELHMQNGGYHLIGKKTERRYAAWDDSQYSYNFYNPYSEQFPVIEIRPAFDYLPYEDPGHFQITNFSNASAFSIFPSGQGISCQMNSEGIVSINNTGTGIQGCRINIPPENFSRYISQDFKRGIGLEMTGDGKGAVVLVHVYNNNQGERDFEFKVDFSGKKQLISGDPSIQYEYPRSYYPYIYISAGPGTHLLQFHSLKKMKEKSSKLVNPVLSVNNDHITFPHSLYINDKDPNILEYDGRQGKYRLYNSNHELLSEYPLPTEFRFLSGNNSIGIQADNSDSNNTSKADIRITAYDDEDGDMIPTKGSYNQNATPCRGTSSFCDDNCPHVYNPDQMDSNGNGIGDACE